MILYALSELRTIGTSVAFEYVLLQCMPSRWICVSIYIKTGVILSYHLIHVDSSQEVKLALLQKLNAFAESRPGCGFHDNQLCQRGGHRLYQTLHESRDQHIVQGNYGGCTT